MELIIYCYLLLYRYLNILIKNSDIEILKKINNEDKTIAYAVEKALPSIAQVVEKVYEAFLNGGRLIYMGAGTSGRIGILDAVECPPTYGVDYNMVQCLMAGGEKAFIKAVEGAEDSLTQGKEDLVNINLTKNDVVIGIAASGRTPYVIGGLHYANEIGDSQACAMIHFEEARLYDNSNQIEAARICLARYTKRQGKIWIRVFPHLSKSKKPLQVRMGSGKGAPDKWVAVVKDGTILFEMAGIDETLAREALRLASYKLPIKCKIVSRKSGE